MSNLVPVFRITVRKKGEEGRGSKSKKLLTVFKDLDKEEGKNMFALPSRESNQYDITPEDAGLTGLRDYFIDFYEVKKKEEEIPF